MRNIYYYYDEDSDSDDDKDREADVDTYDQYVGACVQLHVGGKMLGRKVTDIDGSVRGNASSNPNMDWETGDIDFSDGIHAKYTVIAENVYAQCDEEGSQYVLMEGIVGKKI
jgi:hypothetical protein